MFALFIAAAVAGAAPETPALPPFAIGTTTIQAVAERLGRPTSTSTMADGTQIVVYVQSKTRVKGSTFVPVVGLFAAGAKSHMVVRTFTFGADGVLKNYSTTDTSADCNTGLFAASCH